MEIVLLYNFSYRENYMSRAIIYVLTLGAGLTSATFIIENDCSLGSSLLALQVFEHKMLHLASSNLISKGVGKGYGTSNR
jgi:hypothetical protein